jgi:broad specificity phosphatase PhoE
MRRVHLVRHGRTASNRERRTMGWLDEGIEPGWVRAAAAVADVDHAHVNLLRAAH